MPPLTLMIKPASGACNMRCGYCFYMDEMDNRSEGAYGFMGGETAGAVIRRALTYAEGSVSFVFQGGEPTLVGAGFYRDWLSAVKQQNTRGLQVTYALQTNALELTDDMLSVLKEGGFLVGVSLDGNEAIHDGRRRTAGGAPTFARVSSNIDRLREHGIPYNVLCVVDQVVAGQAKATYEALRRHGYLQFIPCLEPLGETDTVLSAAAYGEFLVSLFDCYEHDYRAGNYVSVLQFDNWIRMLRGLPPTACGMRGTCAPNYVVESNGQVYPCDFYALDEWLLGNLHTDSLYRVAKSDLLAEFLRQSALPDTKCVGCDWRVLCRGGCRRDRQTGATDQPGLNRLCEGYRLFFDSRYGALDALSKIPVDTLPQQR